MPAKKTTPNKSDFIRSQPASLSTAEIIAAGKKSGLKISSSLVYVVRGRTANPKGTAKKTSTASKSAALTSTSAAKSTKSKADFVRVRSHLSPKEIVDDAKAAGLKLDVGYVYNVRGADKAKTKVTKLAARRSTSSKAAPVPRPITTTSSAEDLLKAVGAEIGLGRAIELLLGERARVHSILRG